MDAILSALGLTKGSVIGGFIGSVISLRFLSELNWIQRIVAVFSGMFIAGYCAPIILNTLDLKPQLEGGIAFLVGLFGMSLAGAVEKAIPEVIKAVNERIAK